MICLVLLLRLSCGDEDQADDDAEDDIEVVGEDGATATATPPPLLEVEARIRRVAPPLIL